MMTLKSPIKLPGQSIRFVASLFTLYLVIYICTVSYFDYNNFTSRHDNKTGVVRQLKFFLRPQIEGGFQSHDFATQRKDDGNANERKYKRQNDEREEMIDENKDHENYHALSEYVGTIVQTYRGIATNYVYTHTMSWHRYGALQPDESRFQEQHPNIITNTESHRHEKENLKNKSTLLLRFQKMKNQLEFNVRNLSHASSRQGNIENEEGNTTMNHSLSSIVWDDKEDIPFYFSELLRRCAIIETPLSNNDTTSVPPKSSFRDRCWKYLLSLVDTPRCTVRLDSRYTCRKKIGSGAEEQNFHEEAIVAKPVKEILRDHWEADTINIAVCGAGPVGLQLASALARLSELSSSSHSKSRSARPPPKIRIVIFEKRIHESGHKRPYIRDWITDIRYGYFDYQFLKSNETQCCRPEAFYNILLHDDYRHVSLPIKVIETLTLLSLRYHSETVKFVFDDYSNFLEVLNSTPNLITFDVTGHELSKFADYDTKWSPDDESVRIRKWKPRDPFHEPYSSDFDSLQNILSIDEYSVLDNYQALSPIAYRKIIETEEWVLYPVIPRTWNPAIYHFLKIADVRITSEELEQLVVLEKFVTALQTEDDTDGLCNESCKDQIGDYACRRYCNRLFVWWFDFRDDITAEMAREHPGFSHITVFVNLSPDQVKAFEIVTGGLGPKEKWQLPLRSLPVEDMCADPVFQANHVNTVLEFLYNRSAGTYHPTAELFQLRPYMYADPLFPASRHQRRNGGMNGTEVKEEGEAMGTIAYQSPPRLRIGDSLFVGDPNRSTGLQSHAIIIKMLVKELREKWYYNDDEE